jgi:hypothetical protein
MSYGTTPTGFVRKPLVQILAEIEENAKQVFGENVIQSPESPLGQLNRLCASLGTTLWETAEDTYQSYDPDQAEGVRLEQLGRIRLLERMDGEGDADYRAAITNQGRARIDIADLSRAASQVEGVSFAKVFINPKDETDADGIPGHAVAVAVIGGDDDAVARAIRPYIVPGIDAYGNARADIDVDGYCRTIYFVRPTPIRLGLQLQARVKADRLGCPPPSAVAIGLTVSNALTGQTRPVNGQDIDLHLIRTAVTAAYPNVEIIGGTYTLLPDGDLMPLPALIPFLSIAEIVPASVTVAIVE